MIFKISGERADKPSTFLVASAASVRRLGPACDYAAEFAADIPLACEEH
jgi:hypothetical protein